MIVGAAGAWLTLLPLSLFNLIWAFTWLTVAQGLSFPISISMLLEPHKKQAGAVSALSGSVQMGLSGIFGGYLVQNWIQTQFSLGLFYLLVAIVMMSVLISTRSAVYAQQPSV